MNRCKNILWFTWKDCIHPLSGGAEVVNEELAKRLVNDGYAVTFLVSGFDGCEKEEVRDGFKIVRVGNKFTVYFYAYRYYKKCLQNWPDIVIDEINTIPFFCKYFVKVKNVLFIHQLCREIWFYQMPFPLHSIGYVLEPIYLWLLRDRKVITVSESTKKDLTHYGFSADAIHIISEGITIPPLARPDIPTKFENPTLLSLGSIRSMKRTHHVLKAFEIAKEQIKDLELIVVGDGSGKYGEKILRMLETSHYRNSIKYVGRVGTKEKIELMQKAHLLAVTSIKEGWGLIVTEANSQGTPAIVYDVDGLRDSVRHNETGVVCAENTPENVAHNIVEMLKIKYKYEMLRTNAWRWSKEITFERSYKDFITILEDGVREAKFSNQLLKNTDNQHEYIHNKV